MWHELSQKLNSTDTFDYDCPSVSGGKQHDNIWKFILKEN
jgi:hypothetical protein